MVPLDVERLAQRRLVAGRGEEVGLARGGGERSDELLHLGLRDGTDEGVHHLTVTQREHRRDRLDPERRGDLRVLVDVHLGELDGTIGSRDGLFEHRTQGAARSAPRRPEVHHDRNRLGSVEDLGLERGVGDVCHPYDDTGRSPRTSPGEAAPVASLRMPSSDTPDDDARPVGIDVEGVSAWFAGHVPEVEPPLRFTLVAGGRSNLTYRVDGASGPAVALRRPPVSHVLPTAHDMAREHRILSALAPTPVPVPVPIGLCNDPGVTGAPFYVMTFVEGLVLRDAETGGPLLPGDAERRTAGFDLVDTLATLHMLDPDQVGLGDLAKRDGYVERQLRRWGAQFAESAAAGVAAPGLVERVGAALAARVPPQRRATVVHGDFRIDNVVLHTDGTVAAVLDWELCTLGDPMADLGTFLDYWGLPADGEPVLGRVPASALCGFPAADELLGRYASASGADVAAVGYFMAFGYWRLACILQGVYARYAGGAKAGDPDSVEHFPATVVRLAELAAATLGES
jgi:aminoglycoside phosphotransferase (APT) family kinase protein